MSGFVEIRMKSVNVFKMLFNKSKEWENRYVVFQSCKLFVYAGQNYSKPLEIYEITNQLKIREIRKADINGKENVLEITANNDQPALMLSAATESNYDKWLKAFRNLRE